MVRLTRLHGRGTTLVMALAGLLAIFGIVAGTGAASADTNIKATYPVTGSTFIAAANFTLTLGPGKLAATADLTTGKVTANLGAGRLCRSPRASGGPFRPTGLDPSGSWC